MWRAHWAWDGAQARGAEVLEDGWEGRAMSGSDKSWVCVCTLLESHVNEQNIPGKIL